MKSLTHSAGDSARTIRRFFSHITQTDDGCWEWDGRVTDNGYGIFSHSSGEQRAHRYAFELFVGEIPGEYVVDHVCRNRACVNPIHLEAITQRENVMRGLIPVTARNAADVLCPNGHRLDDGNAYVAPNRTSREAKRGCRACRAEATARHRDRKAVA